MTDALPDLLTWAERYPSHPGFKRCGTSEEAAKAVAPTVKEAHAIMLAKYRELGPMTAHEAGAACGWKLDYARPRNSELVKLGELIDTGTRRTCMGHKSSTVWDVKR